MLTPFLASDIRKSSVLLGFMGDVMLGRLTNEKIRQTSFMYPWGDILPLLKKTDLNIANLETAITKSKHKVPKAFNFKTDPNNERVLQEADIGVVSLANNHIKDFGDEGLQDTLFALKQANIAFVGAGLNNIQARKPVIIEKNGIKIGIIGATDNEPGWKAKKDKPGIFYFSIDDIEPLLNAIQGLKSKVDICIMSLHWGPNMRQRPSAEFQQAAHMMVDVGADIIHGHSAHIFQGIEHYKDALIMYDTGDFVDDYRVDPVLRNDQSFFFMVEVAKKGVKRLQLVPVLIADMQVNKAVGADAQKIMHKMQQLSAELGTSISDQGLLVLEA